MNERNPYIAIGALVVALALASGFGMRYGMNAAIAGLCVALAVIGTLVLLSPQDRLRLAPVDGGNGSQSGQRSAFGATTDPGIRDQLRQQPRMAVGFVPGDVDHVEGGEFGAGEGLPVRQLGQLPADASALAVAHETQPMPNTSGAFTLDRFEIRAASRRGSDHAVLGEPRQDDYIVAQAANGRYLVVVLADGRSVAENAHYGSYWSSRLLAQSIDRNLRDGVPGIEKMLSRTRDEVTSFFHEQFTDGTRLRSIATTLVGFIAPVDGGPAAGFRVGATDIVVDGANGWTSIFGDPPEGITEAVFPKSIEAEVAPIELDAQALLLVSDGVGEPLVTNPEVAAAFSEALVAPLGEADFVELTNFEMEEARGDRTAIAVWYNQDR